MAGPERKRSRRRGGGAARRAGLARATILVLLADLQAAWAGQCVFRQTCVGSLDGNCAPEPTDSTVFPNGTLANASFPLDAAHGFGVPHDGVWNGDMADSSGRCQDLTARADPVTGRCLKDGFGVVPVVCPEYAWDGCCTWEQNWVLYQNLQTLVATFGGAQGCTACAVNLVNFWCGVICSPNQHAFLQLHDPPTAVRRDDLTDSEARVLQVDVWLQAGYACELFDSCRSTTIVGSVTGMQSGLGLLTYQAQTGAVGHGEFFFIHFDNTSTSTATGGGKELWRHDTLACSSFPDPGAATVPFPYPAPANASLTQCSCTYCQSSCSALPGLDLPSTSSSSSKHGAPVSPLEGFDGRLVGGAYAALAVLAMVITGYRYWSEARRRRRRRRGVSLSSSSSLLALDEDDDDDDKQQAASLATPLLRGQHLEGQEEEEEEGGGRPGPPQGGGFEDEEQQAPLSPVSGAGGGQQEQAGP